MRETDLTVYEFGYRGKKMPAIKARLEELDAMIVDVRLAPGFPGRYWWRGDFQKQLQERYVWIRDLGNVHYKEDKPVLLADEQRGIPRLSKMLSEVKDVVLMCACEKLGDCHRSVVIEKLKSFADYEFAVAPLFEEKKQGGLF